MHGKKTFSLIFFLSAHFPCTPRPHGRLRHRLALRTPPQTPPEATRPHLGLHTGDAHQPQLHSPTSDGQHNRLRRLKNCVPQGLVQAPMLFNIYVHDPLPTLAKKYGYADDLAILLSDKCWRTIEDDLTANMSTMSTYLKNWRLKLSIAKTMSSFHFNKRDRRELKVMVDGNARCSSRQHRRNLE